MEPKRRVEPARSLSPSGIRRPRTIPPASGRGVKPPEEQADVGDQTQERPKKKKKILLVDDSLTALMMNQLVLRKTPHEVVTARDGREAVEKALMERPDLIVMDVVMPELNGFQACKRLRSIEQTRSTPILLVTTRSEMESVANGYAAGCNEYLFKPLSGAELLSKVRSYLGE